MNQISRDLEHYRSLPLNQRKQLFHLEFRKLVQSAYKLSLYWEDEPMRDVLHESQPLMELWRGVFSESFDEECMKLSAISEQMEVTFFGPREEDDSECPDNGDLTPQDHRILIKEFGACPYCGREAKDF